MVTAERRPSDLVRIIVGSGSATKLLAEHAADASGHCPRCRSGGASSGTVKSPCTLYEAARAAMKLGGSGT